MRRLSSLLAATALALPLVAAAQTTPAAASAATSAAPQEVISGNARGVAYAAHRVLRSQTQLETLLRRIYSGQIPPSAPKFDFSHEVLVYYALGTAAHGATKLYVRSGRLEGGVLHVRVEIARSTGTCLGADNLAAPFVIAALPFPAAAVASARFEVTRKSYPCR